jgi:hypothetical protein
MENKLKIPLAFIGGSTAGYLASPLSSFIINKALIKNITTKVEKFKSSLSGTQSSIYKTLEKRVLDIDNFEEKSIERDNIQDEITNLRTELVKLLSPNQMSSFTELEELEDKLYKKMKRTRNATMAAGGLLGIALSVMAK